VSIYSDADSPAFTVSGNQGNEWFEACVDLPTNDVVQVEFLAERGNRADFIALSNVTINNEACLGKCYFYEIEL
jgi:hypothetical protein